MRFHGVSAKNLVDHLMERYGKIWASDLEAYIHALAEPTEADRPIDVYFQRVYGPIQLAQYGKAPYTPAQIVLTVYYAVNKTGLHSIALKELRKKATAEKAWASFKHVFAEEYHGMLEETKVTNGGAGFHSANSMQEIGGELEHLAMAANSYKDVFTKLAEAVETIKINKLSLTTQLRNAMKIKLEMANNLNLKSTQTQYPEYNILSEKARE